MLSFATPFWLLLIPLPVLLWLYFSKKSGQGGSHRAAAIIHPHTDLLMTLHQTGSRQIPWLWLAACALLLMALAQPRWFDSDNPENYQGHEMILAIDVSASMRATDYAAAQRPVSRLDIVKQTVREFLDLRHGDRIGMVIFADDAYLYAPLSDDINLLTTLVDDIEPGLAGDKTALGDAIALAADKLADSDGKTRLLVLFSDGSNTSGSIQPLVAAQLAKQSAIRIYTIGIGRQGKVLFPQGPVASPLLSELPLDEQMLQQMAEITGGQFFYAGDRHQLLASIAAIDQEQGIELKPAHERNWYALYIWPLLLAIMLLLVSEWHDRQRVLP